MRTAAAIVVLCLAAGAAQAQAPAKATAPAQAPVALSPPHTVRGVTVVATTDPPKLASSYPAEGASVPAGVLVIRLTFDQRMASDGWDVAGGPEGTAPPCVERPRLLGDGKSFVLLCTVLPKTHYAIALNSQGGEGFRNEGDYKAVQTTLAFTTGDEVGPVTVAQAMKAAALTNLDVPVIASPGPIGSLGH
jgi:hypothetical protein